MITAAFLAYLGVIAAITARAWRRTRTLDDYLAGGRRVRAWVAALSAGASDMSGWLLLGLPGLAVVAPAAAAWTAAGLLAGTWLNWRFVAAPLREASARHNAMTLPVLFERELGDGTGIVRILTAVCIVTFFLFYTSAGLVAGGKLFSTVFGMPYAAAVVLGAAVVSLYTLFGGFLAVTWTDALQALMMLVALTLVAALLTFGADPWPPAGATFSDLDGIAMASALAWGLGYMGQPHVLARFIAIESVERVPRARRIAVAWTAVVLLAAVAVGLGGRNLPGLAGDPERVFMIAIDSLLPAWLAGFSLAAILAAIMSTADSQLLVTSSALAEDLLPRLRRGSAAANDRLRTGRRTVLAVCVVATLIALDSGAGVLDLVAYAWAGFGATIGPALLIALYVPRANVAATITGLLAGATTVVVWARLDGGVFELYELLPGFLAGAGANLLVLACSGDRGLTSTGVRAGETDR